MEGIEMVGQEPWELPGVWEGEDSWEQPGIRGGEEPLQGSLPLQGDEPRWVERWKRRLCEGRIEWE